MKTEELKKQAATFIVTASDTEGENKISIHRYDSNGQQLEVQTIAYPSVADPKREDSATLENALETHGIQADLWEQDGYQFQGLITL